MSLLHVCDLTVHRKGVACVRELHFPPLAAGEILGVIGPNGAGKSTLLSALAGQLPYAGEVAVAQGSFQALGRERWRSHVALMPQAPPQASALSAYELLRHAASVLDIPYQGRVLERHLENLLGQLGVSVFAHRPLAQLSGGQRQLVGLALTLLRPASVFLLDEPTSALDLYWRHLVMSHIKAVLGSRKGCAVAVLHDLDLALNYCDQLLLIQQGQVVSCGPPSSVLTPERLADIFHVEAQLVPTPGGGLKLHVSRALSKNQEFKN